jgi:hypothetical protein
MFINSEVQCNKVNHTLVNHKSKLISLLEENFSCKIQVDTLECQLINPIEYAIIVKLKVLQPTGLFSFVATEISTIEAKLRFNKTLDCYADNLVLEFSSNHSESIFCTLISPKDLTSLYILYYPDKDIWKLETELVLEKQGYFNQYRQTED